MPRRTHYLAALGIPILGLTAVLVMSRLYWGYWVKPPSSGTTAAHLATLERFSCLRPGAEPCLWSNAQSPGFGREELIEAAQHANYSSGETPLGRLAAALTARGLYPDSPDPVPASVLPEIRSALGSAGQLRPGSPGYPMATRLWGHVATGKSPSGQPIVLAALSGSEASNDHYPYYEAVLTPSANGQLRLLDLTFYWYDVAGLEGAAHWLAGIAVTLAATAIWAIVSAFRAIRWWLRRRAA